MLAEARGYRLSLVLAHQHLAQLPRELRDAAAANARNKVYLSASPDDARQLERHVAPELTAHDLAHLDNHHAAARLLAAGADQAAFTLATRPLPPAVAGRAAQIRAVARRRYGRTDTQRRQERERHQLRGREDPRRRRSAATSRPTAAPTDPPTAQSGQGTRPRTRRSGRREP